MGVVSHGYLGLCWKQIMEVWPFDCDSGPYHISQKP